MTPTPASRFVRTTATAVLLVLACDASAHAQAVVDSETIAGLGARNIGSAAMSGRITAIAGVHEKGRLTLYIGAASGGVWKSQNGGTTYKPVFDKEGVQSIGAVTIDPTDSQVIWVGSGESWTRNSVSIGDGIYKSTDGGETWKNMGLRESERIVKVIVSPTDHNTVYACVPGKLWSDSDERGVYRTTDGGVTWSKVLRGGNLSTGCSMLSMDPRDSKTLYAGLWDFRRKGWTFRSGGDGETAPSASGLMKSTDGGATWTDIASSAGLPPKPWGRVAVTVAPSNANIVYAFIEAVPPRNALYRSDDGGKTWAMKDRSFNMIWRPFYFANIIVDPKNPDRVYKTGGSLISSSDGGASFTNIANGAHGDFHDVFIDADRPDDIITVDDGGIWYSYDAGNKWVKGENLPISQFYHVSVDMNRPYRVYGGLQDNSSWVGESEFPGGITNHQWENLYGGDGFWTFPDPSDPDYVYAEAQGGAIGRVNRKTHESRGIQPLPYYQEHKLRYNWNTPIHLSETSRGVLYIGAQFLFRSRDHGETWDRISPDLTTNDPEKQKQEQSGGITVDNSAAEMHTTIYSISESPKDAKVIWVGTDDGNVQVTRDDGKSWTNVTPNIRGLPPASWVSWVEGGRVSPATVFATFDRHTVGDMKPYAYRSDDYGRTWSSIIPPDAPVRGYAHVIKQDLVNSRLLFLGTELGLWVSVDAGAHWARFKGGGLPTVAVRDLAIHPRDNDLVIATHGRGIWIVDDITPLRGFDSRLLANEVAFAPVRPTVAKLNVSGGWANGDAMFVGQNPSGDAVITYYLRKRHIFGDMKIEVLDSAQHVVGTLPTSKRRGLSRVTWGMRLPAPTVPAAASATGASVGPRVLPGRYTVRMTKDSATYTTPLVVLPDARASHSAADRKAQYELSLKLSSLLGEMSAAVDRINDVRLALDDRSTKVPSTDSLVQRLLKAEDEVDAFRKKIVATKEGGMITGEERLRENLADLYTNVIYYDGKPSKTQQARTSAIGRELADVSRSFDVWVQREMPPLNRELAARKLPPIPTITP